MYDLKRELKSNNKTIYELDSTQFNLLFELASELDIPGSMAFNTLLALDSVSYNEPVYFPPAYKSFSIKPNILGDNTINHHLKVFPNPAKNYITIEYLLNEYPEIQINGLIRITDQNGKIIDQIMCIKNREQFVYSIEKFNSGTYFCSLFINDKLNDVIKFIISK